MNQGELISAVASETEYTKQTVRDILLKFLDVIIDEVSKGEKVTLSGFGTFDRTLKAAHIGRNPITGESLDVPEKFHPHFKFSKEFKTKVAGEKV